MKQLGRSKRGHSVSELPVVLIILLLGILIPVIDFCTVSMRTSFLDGAARSAAHVAAKAHTFWQGSPNDPSVRMLARAETQRSLNGFTGIRVQRITPRIVRTNIENPAETRTFDRPLPAAPDTEKYVYHVEVELRGDVDPLFKFANLWGDIPGLTRPLPFTAKAREVFENPFWLTR